MFGTHDQTARFLYVFVKRLAQVLLTALAALVFALPLHAAPGTPGPAGGQGPDYTQDRLVGTMRAGAFSGAVFEDPSGKQTFYRTGKEFADGTRILSVKRRRILVGAGNGSRREYYIRGGKPDRRSSARAGRRGGVPARRNAGNRPRKPTNAFRRR